MSGYFKLKTVYRDLLLPLLDFCARKEISAGRIRLVALLSALPAGVSLAWQPSAHWPLLLFVVVLVLRHALHGIAALLSAGRQNSPITVSFREKLLVVATDGILYLPLALQPGVASAWIVIAVMLGLIHESMGTVETKGGIFRRDYDLMGANNRALWFGAVGLLLGLGVAPGLWLTLMLLLFNFMLLITVAHRFRRLRRAV